MSVRKCGEREDSMLVLETTIDDMNPEFFPFLMEEVLAAGAVDAYFIPVHMKKVVPAPFLQFFVR